MRLNWKHLNPKWGFTLIELTIVVTLLIILIYALYPKFAWFLSKQKDVTRVKIAQEYQTYYEWIKQSVGSYPNWNITNATTWLRKFAKAVDSNSIWAKWERYVEFLFEWDKDDQGFYTNTWDSKLKEMQELMIESWILGSAWDLKTLPEWENMFIFTSKTWKQMVTCLKLYAENSTASEDWDWILDTEDPSSENWHKNGSRIYVFWDLKLWNQLWDAAKNKCKDDLIDPRSL